MTDYKLWTIAVASNSLNLTLVPKELVDYTMSKSAVTNNGWALEFIPKKHKTFELLCIALETISSIDAIPVRNIIYNLTNDEQEFIRLKYGL